MIVNAEKESSVRKIDVGGTFRSFDVHGLQMVVYDVIEYWASQHSTFIVSRGFIASYLKQKSV